MTQRAVLTVLGAMLATGCDLVPIDADDASNPTATFRVKDAQGQWQNATEVDYHTNTAQAPVEIMCVVEDPQGVRSIDLRVSDPTVDHFQCQGSLYGYSATVEDLPEPIGEVLSGSTGTVPTTLPAFTELADIFFVDALPPAESGPCSPGQNTLIALRCTGENWADDATARSTQAFLQVHLNPN